jgi:hypothetical protein
MKWTDAEGRSCTLVIVTDTNDVPVAPPTPEQVLEALQANPEAREAVERGLWSEVVYVAEQLSSWRRWAAEVLETPGVSEARSRLLGRLGGGEVLAKSLVAWRGWAARLVGTFEDGASRQRIEALTGDLRAALVANAEFGPTLEDTQGTIQSQRKALKQLCGVIDPNHDLLETDDSWAGACAKRVAETRLALTQLQAFKSAVAYELGAERNPDQALDALRARLKEWRDTTEKWAVAEAKLAKFDACFRAHQIESDEDVCETLERLSNAAARGARELEEARREWRKPASVVEADLAAVKLALQASDDDVGGGTVAEVVARVVRERDEARAAFARHAQGSDYWNGRCAEEWARAEKMKDLHEKLDVVAVQYLERAEKAEAELGGLRVHLKLEQNLLQICAKVCRGEPVSDGDHEAALTVIAPLLHQHDAAERSRRGQAKFGSEDDQRATGDVPGSSAPSAAPTATSPRERRVEDRSTWNASATRSGRCSTTSTRSTTRAARTTRGFGRRPEPCRRSGGGSTTPRRWCPGAGAGPRCWRRRGSGTRGRELQRS